MLAVELHLTALNSKAEPDESLTKEFSRMLASEPHEAIQWAFREWRDHSPYFPAVSEIKTLVTRWHQARYHETEERRRKRERKELDAARGRGELLEFADLKKQLADVAAQKTMP